MLVEANVGHQETQIEHVNAASVHERAHPEEGEDGDDQPRNKRGSQGPIFINKKQEMGQNVDAIRDDGSDVDDQVSGANGRKIVSVEHQNASN